MSTRPDFSAFDGRSDNGRTILSSGRRQPGRCCQGRWAAGSCRSVEQRAYPMSVAVMGGSVRIGSRFRNCYRTIHMRRCWLRSGGGRGDGLRRPLDDPLSYTQPAPFPLAYDPAPYRNRPGPSPEWYLCQQDQDRWPIRGGAAWGGQESGRGCGRKRCPWRGRPWSCHRRWRGSRRRGFRPRTSTRWPPL